MFGMHDERLEDLRFMALPGGFGGDPRGGFGRHGWGRGGFGSRRERMFDSGDFRLVVLKLLLEQPSYGYQLIKTMEERLSGGYAPSAGVVYPTLTMLEEEGLAAVSVETGRKVYSVTPEGEEYLRSNSRRVKELFERMEEAGRGFERERSPEIMHAFINLRAAMTARMARGKMTKEEVRRVADAVNAAAKAIYDI